MFINQPDFSNAFGISLGGGTNRDVIVRDNKMYDMRRRLFRIDASTSGWSGIELRDNTLVGLGDCIVDHTGPTTDFVYAGGQYFGMAPADAWLCLNGNTYALGQWATTAPEPDAAQASLKGIEVRNLDSYAADLGLAPSLDAFAAEARTQSRHTYRSEFTAAAASEYLRAGYP